MPEPKPVTSEDLQEKINELKKLEKEHLLKFKKYEKQLETLGNRNSYSKTDADAGYRSEENYEYMQTAET